MQIFKSICRLEKKLGHFENFTFFWILKCSKHRIRADAGSVINYFLVILSAISPSFIEIRPLAAKIWPKHCTWGSESPMWPLSKNWKIWISSTMKIHFDEEGECFAPLPSLWRVPQVSPIEKSFQKSFGDGTVMIFDDLSHGVHDFSVEGPERRTGGTHMVDIW